MENEIEKVELAMQADCFQWHWNTYPHLRKTLFHVNGKAKNAIEGSKFKAIGVVKGISDFILILPQETVYIELKTNIGKQSSDQKLFQAQVEDSCQRYFLVRSFEEFKSLINKLYGSAKGK